MFDTKPTPTITLVVNGAHVTYPILSAKYNEQDKSIVYITPICTITSKQDNTFTMQFLNIER